MADSSFLSQLEQRTEQVKVTLANLEAERARIENMISQLQPVVPHYDALLAAERALRDANLQLHELGPAPVEEAPLHPQEAESQHGGSYDAEAALRVEEEAGIAEQPPEEGYGEAPGHNDAPPEPWNT